MNLQPITGRGLGLCRPLPANSPHQGPASLNRRGVRAAVGRKYSSGDRLLSKGRGCAERCSVPLSSPRIGQLTPLLIEGRLQLQLGPLPTPRGMEAGVGLQRQGEVVQPCFQPPSPPRPAPDTQPLLTAWPWDWPLLALGPGQQAEG